MPARQSATTPSGSRSNGRMRISPSIAAITPAITGRARTSNLGGSVIVNTMSTLPTTFSAIDSPPVPGCQTDSAPDCVPWSMLGTPV